MLSDKIRIIKNILSLTVGNILSRICGLMLVIVLARYLGPNMYGVYSLAFTYYTIMYFVSNLGLDTYFVKEAARQKKIKKGFLETNLSLKIVPSCLSILLLILLVNLLNYNATTKTAICLFSIALIFSNIGDSFKSIFSAKEMMAYTSIVEILRSILSLSLILVAIYYLGGNILNILSMQVLSFAISAIIACLIVNRIVTPLNGYKFNLEKGRQIVFNSLPFWYVTAIFIINTRIDILMISWLTEEQKVGLYTSAVELINVIMIVPMMINKAFFPAISRYFKNGKNEMYQLSNFGLKLSITLGVPISFGCYILSEEIITFIFGVEYHGAVIALKILSINLFVQFGGTFLGWLFTATDEIYKIVIINSIALLINLVGNLLMIPKYGIAGAAITTVAARVFVSFIMNYLRIKQFNEIKYFVYYWRPIIGSIVMGYLVLRIEGVHIIPLVFIGAIIYLIIFTILGGVRKSEIKALRAILSRK